MKAYYYREEVIVMSDAKQFEKYGASEHKNFRIIDHIGKPHPYCITPKHLKYNNSVYLDEEGIRRAEQQGAQCDTCRAIHKKSGTPILSYDEHTKALVIECKKDIKTDKKAQRELFLWVQTIVDKAEEDNYAGFAFLKAY